MLKVKPRVRLRIVVTHIIFDVFSPNAYRIPFTFAMHTAGPLCILVTTPLNTSFKIQEVRITPQSSIANNDKSYFLYPYNVLSATYI